MMKWGPTQVSTSEERGMCRWCHNDGPTLMRVCRVCWTAALHRGAMMQHRSVTAVVISPSWPPSVKIMAIWIGSTISRLRLDGLPGLLS
ncbi:hypothetical protein RRG08_025094 [Elysia crispata]|uniref:Uncharacterized protein n=1 Tax=Elysia crispata TaxID=231223 RepID=A0AAE1AKE1_9GAST|nr:hypothetical protein RRG08_025094 [Elysia crispata]